MWLRRQGGRESSRHRLQKPGLYTVGSKASVEGCELSSELMSFGAVWDGRLEERWSGENGWEAVAVILGSKSDSLETWVWGMAVELESGQSELLGRD